MNVKRILCPIDFSGFNQAANDYASLLAKSCGAVIIYLHVSFPEVTYGTYANVDVDRQAERDRNRLHEIKPTSEEVEALYAIEFGPPAQRIVHYADENDIDLIVIATHGRTGIRRALMGSVAEAVVRTANCPVVAIKSESKILQPNTSDDPVR